MGKPICHVGRFTDEKIKINMIDSYLVLQTFYYFKILQKKPNQLKLRTI